MPFIVIVALLLAMPGPQAPPPSAPNANVHALFVFNFVKFTDWSGLAAAEPLTVCVVGDTGMAGALVGTARDQLVDGHPLDVAAIGADGSLRHCHVLFISKSVTERSAALLDGLKRLPLLTISDSEGFAQSTGIVELYVEGGRTRFAINTDAASRAGLRLSSRLLALARIVRDGPLR